MISRDELMHHRLQAWLRENKSEDLEYLGYYEDTLGVKRHWYRIDTITFQLIVLKELI